MFNILRAAVPEPIRKTLRGDQNSVKTRFFSNPREKLTIAIMRKVMGGSYLAWYGRRLDGYLAGKTGASLLETEYFTASGDEDLTAMKALGLMPHHTMFEFGTGEGRSAQHFVGYLEPGHFTGNDISVERSRRFHEYFEAINLSDRKPRHLVTSDNSFEWFDGETFDYIFSQAVISHMPDDECKEVLANLHKIMHRDSIAAFVFSEVDGGPASLRYTAKDFFRSPQLVIEWANQFGLVGEVRSECLDYGHGCHVKNLPLGESGRVVVTSALMVLRLAPDGRS